MTISSTTRVVQYVGPTGANFGFAFKVFEKADLVVIRTDLTTGVDTTLTLNTDYTVSLSPDQNYNAGGTVTLTAGSLAANTKLTITSHIDNLQPTDLSNQGGFYPDVINNSLDRATIQIQQLDDTIGRALTSSISDDPNLAMSLPSAVTRANKYLAFDASGVPLAATGTNTPGISFPGEVDIVSNNGGTNNPASRDIVFIDNATELARIKGATGRVGIGTATPNVKLDVRESTNTYVAMRVRNSGAPGGGAELSIDGTGLAKVWNNDGEIAFGTVVTERMRLGSAGLGININAPANRLHVNGNAATDTRIQLTNGATTGTTANDGLQMRVDATGVTYLYNGENTALLFGTNNAERMRIANDGKVGVNVGSPSQLLHINADNATAGAIQLTNGTTSGTTATSGFQLRLDSAAAAYITNYSATALLFQTSSVAGTPTERMRIAADGTITAQAPIDVATGIVTVTGNATVAATTRFLTCNGTASIALTLPSAASYTGKEIYIKTIAAFTVTSASSNVVPRAGGAASNAILGAVAGNWALLVSNGTNWVIMAGT